MSRRVELRSPRPTDRLWLVRVGFQRWMIGNQYSWYETPLQIYTAPARALRAPRQPAAIVEVDGRAAGYIGPNPLSGNIEYFVEPWARGGIGTSMIEQYLRSFRPSDKARRFFVAHKNERSRRSLLSAFEALGWSEGDGYSIADGRFGWSFWIEPGGSTREG